MYVSGNTVSYRLLTLFLLLTPFLLSLSSALTASYKCIKRGDKDVIVFYVVNSGTDKIAKIYAKGKEPTCSSPSVITGDGNVNTPFKLSLDVGKDVTDNKCGVVQSGTNNKIAKITFVASATKGNIIISPSKEIDITCDFTNVKIDASANTGVAFAKENANELTFKIEMIFKDKPASLNVGDNTQLTITLKDTNEFKAIKPYTCWALRKSDDANKVKLTENYCPVTAAPAKITFTPDATNPMIVKSNEFKAFRFFDSDKLFISCEVDICLDATKCAKQTCTARKKRSVPDANHHSIHLVRTNASVVITGKGSSTL